MHIFTQVSNDFFFNINVAKLTPNIIQGRAALGNHSSYIETSCVLVKNDKISLI